MCHCNVKYNNSNRNQCRITNNLPILIACTIKNYPSQTFHLSKKLSKVQNKPPMSAHFQLNLSLPKQNLNSCKVSKMALFSIIRSIKEASHTSQAQTCRPFKQLDNLILAVKTKLDNSNNRRSWTTTVTSLKQNITNRQRLSNSSLSSDIIVNCSGSQVLRVRAVTMDLQQLQLRIY